MAKTHGDELLPFRSRDHSMVPICSRGNGLGIRWEASGKGYTESIIYKGIAAINWIK